MYTIIAVIKLLTASAINSNIKDLVAKKPPRRGPIVAEILNATQKIPNPSACFSVGSKSATIACRAGNPILPNKPKNAESM